MLSGFDFDQIEYPQRRNTAATKKVFSGGFLTFPSKITTVSYDFLIQFNISSILENQIWKFALGPDIGSFKLPESKIIKFKA